MYISVSEKRRRIRNSVIKNVGVFLFVFIAVLSFFYIIRFPVVNGDSMVPTYNDKDVLMVLYHGDFDIGDVVVIWSSSLDEYLVKRVIGKGGDVIEITSGHVYRNGKLLYEPYILSQVWSSPGGDTRCVVPEGCIYVLGDNRVSSMDSRTFGSLPLESVFGRVLRKLL